MGIDNVDLQAATEVRPGRARFELPRRNLADPIPRAQLGCLVVNAPTANTIAAAEHAIALICSLARNVAQADASMKACAPPPLSPSAALQTVSQHRPLPCPAKLCSLPPTLPQKGEWKRSKYVGASLVDKTVAIIGFGKARETSPLSIMFTLPPFSLLPPTLSSGGLRGRPPRQGPRHEGDRL